MVEDRSVRPVLRDHSPVCPVCPACNVGVNCGQIIGWIGMHLHGTKVGLGPRKIVIDRDPATSPKGHSSSPTFRAMSTVAKRSPPQQLLSSYRLIVRHSFERYRDFANDFAIKVFEYGNGLDRGRFLLVQTRSTLSLCC